LIRHFHDASSTFLHAGHEWDPLLRDPVGDAEIVCHNDLSIPNTVYRNGRPVALVDGDFASPGRRLWDVAYAAWWLFPLHRPEFMKSIGWPQVDQPRRLRLFVDAYGLREERELLLDVLRERQVRNQIQLRSWVEAGIIPPYDEDDPCVECGQFEYVENIRPHLEAALGR
jgi:aminoglycoside phosphotransferase (APT) family kinase protein